METQRDARPKIEMLLHLLQQTGWTEPFHGIGHRHGHASKNPTSHRESNRRI